jgi:ketosteroid isomerase-like protein
MQTAARTNTQVVQQCYGYFSTGNISALLNELTDDVKWNTPGPRTILPWVGNRKGKKEVEEFFTLLSDNVEFVRFEPREFVEQGDKVVTLGYFEGKSLQTGRTSASEWAMVFTFRDGKICEHREYNDTYEAVQAFE